MPSVPKSPPEGGGSQGDFASLTGRTSTFKNCFRSLAREIFAFKNRFRSLDREIFAFKFRFGSLDREIFAFKNRFRSLDRKIFVFGRLFGSLSRRLMPPGVGSEVSVEGGKLPAWVPKSRSKGASFRRGFRSLAGRGGASYGRFGSLDRRGAFPSAQEKAPRGEPEGLPGSKARARATSADRRGCSRRRSADGRRACSRGRRRHAPRRRRRTSTASRGAGRRA